MRSPADREWVERARRDFYLYFSEHDRRRGTDFLATFPEMADFWGECASEEPLRRLMEAHQRLVPPMNREELRGSMGRQASAVGAAC